MDDGMESYPTAIVSYRKDRKSNYSIILYY